MKECLIVLGLFFSAIPFALSLESYATWRRSPRSSADEIARLVARSYS